MVAARRVESPMLGALHALIRIRAIQHSLGMQVAVDPVRRINTIYLKLSQAGSFQRSRRSDVGRAAGEPRSLSVGEVMADRRPPYRSVGTEVRRPPGDRRRPRAARSPAQGGGASRARPDRSHCRADHAQARAGQGGLSRPARLDRAHPNLHRQEANWRPGLEPRRIAGPG